MSNGFLSNGNARSVLLIGNFLSGPGSGGRAVCEQLASQLRGHGWTVLTTSNKHARLARWVDMMKVAWRHRHEYQAAHVDVFSGWAFFWAESVCWMLRRVRRPYVLTLHGGGLPPFSRRWPVRVRRLLTSAAVVTAPSEYLAAELRSGCPDIVVVPNAIDLSLYPFRLRTRAEPRLIWVRAFHRIYNPVLAPRVVYLLAERFPDIHLTMVGRDKGDGSLQQVSKLARELGIADRIEIVPGVPRKEIPRWLEKADIFLNTAEIDNTPVSVIEALACGLCVVSTNAGGISYLVDDTRHALLVNRGDAPGMADAVSRILNEPSLSAKLSQEARRRTLERDWSQVLPQWEYLMSKVAGNLA